MPVTNPYSSTRDPGPLRLPPLDNAPIPASLTALSREINDKGVYIHKVRRDAGSLANDGAIVRAQLTKLVELPSYNRFVERIGAGLKALCALLHANLGQPTGLAFVDSTSIDVCDNHRISSHRVFRDIAQRGKTSTGWFYGFKLHLIINDRGELLAVKLRLGNVDDRVPVLEMAQSLIGKLVGDKGYISKALFAELWEAGLQLITKVKKNMKNKLMNLFDKMMLRKRALIESVNDTLKNQCQIEHSRHRSTTNFMTHLVAGLVAYTLLPKHPSLNIIHGEVIAL